MELKNHEEISKAISSKVSKTCPMCGHYGFTLDGMEFHHTSFPLNDPNFMRGDFSGVASVPCVSAICDNCGFVASFSLQVLLGKPYTQG